MRYFWKDEDANSPCSRTCHLLVEEWKMPGHWTSMESQSPGGCEEEGEHPTWEWVAVWLLETQNSPSRSPNTPRMLVDNRWRSTLLLQKTHQIRLPTEKHIQENWIPQYIANYLTWSNMFFAATFHTVFREYLSVSHPWVFSASRAISLTQS